MNWANLFWQWLRYNKYGSPQCCSYKVTLFRVRLHSKPIFVILQGRGVLMQFCFVLFFNSPWIWGNGANTTKPVGFCLPVSLSKSPASSTGKERSMATIITLCVKLRCMMYPPQCTFWVRSCGAELLGCNMTPTHSMHKIPRKLEAVSLNIPHSWTLSYVS